MKQRSRHVALMPVGLAGLLWIAGPAAAQHQHPQPADTVAKAPTMAKDQQMLSVGKKQDVKFTVETMVDDLRLRPGLYQLQHRAEGEDHYVHFTEVTEAVPLRNVAGGSQKAHPGEVKCRLEPLAKKASTTTIYTVKEGEDSRRVTKVLIRGENVAHLF